MTGLEGRCGSCGFFRRMSVDDAGCASGECMLGCWPSPLKETGTCAHHKPVGTAWTANTLRSAKRARGQPRRSLDRPVSTKKPLPSEIDLDMEQDEFRSVLREILLDELGLSHVELGDRWQGGELVLVPGRDGTQEKRVPLDTFFHKIVMVRDKLRTLEQKVNGNSSLSADEKVQLQQYITGCYGSLTTFNVLFRDKEEQFSGAKKA